MKKLPLFCFSAALALFTSCSSTVSAPTLAQADSDGNGIISAEEDVVYKKAQEIAAGAPKVPASPDSGGVTKTIRNTASTVGIVRNLQTIFGGF